MIRRGPRPGVARSRGAPGQEGGGGDAVVLLPKSRSWTTLTDSLAKFPVDFMDERGQPGAAGRREPL